MAGQNGWRIGDATVLRIAEQTLWFPAARILPDWHQEAAAADRAWLVPEHMDAAGETIALSVHSWLVRLGGRVILIDTGIGNGKRRASPAFDGLDTPYLARLADAGVMPEQVTDVLITHIHTDHVGWNTVLVDGRWVPSFPNARYVVPRAGHDAFSTPEGRARPDYGMYADSVLPVIEAGQVEFIGPDGGEVLAGLTYHPTPGHSVDHMSIMLRAAGEQAIFAGDVAHHPVQLRRPDWTSVFCADAEQARASRRWVLEQAATQRMPYFSSHFAGSSAGLVLRDGDAYRWEPR